MKAIVHFPCNKWSNSQPIWRSILIAIKFSFISHYKLTYTVWWRPFCPYYLNDSILESRFPGGLQFGSRILSCSKDLFMSFIRARSRSQADFLYCSGKVENGNVYEMKWWFQNKIKNDGLIKLKSRRKRRIVSCVLFIWISSRRSLF